MNVQIHIGFNVTEFYEKSLNQTVFTEIDLNQGCGSDIFGWSRIPNNTGSPMSNWIIFYITLLNREFLLKWYNFF